MSNSSLVSIQKISPYKSERTYRNSSSTGKISKITIHHMAGKMSAEGCLSWFASSQCRASSNYVIGYDGTIGLSVPEAYRSWCSSNGDNDNIAITIELSNTGSNDSQWPVSDTVLQKCIVLCWDICRRNGIDKLVYTGKTDGNLTRHDMFIDKVCPGPYLGSKFPYIVEQVNKRLNDPYYRPVCVKGNQNDYVKEFQEILLKLGYDFSEYGADGSFGNLTEAAVKKFQEANGIEADGEVGTLTWAALLGKPQTSTPTTDIKEEEKTVSNICTAAEAVAEMEYFIGYYEKASSDYATTDAKSAFEKNIGSNNYTYAGYICGTQAQPWCAAQVSTAIWKACGKDKTKAKEVMLGVWPYVSCNQLWDFANNDEAYWSYYQRWTLGKGDRVNYTPHVGDIIIFTDNGITRSHTGMVYAVDDTYVYTIEGNSANMCRKRSYLLASSYIYGYVRPRYAEGTEDSTTIIEQYGKKVFDSPELHLLTKGCAGPEVKTVQRILRGADITADDNKEIEIDGEFGEETEQAIKKAQKLFGFSDDWCDGGVGKYTWPKLLNELN